MDEPCDQLRKKIIQECDVFDMRETKIFKKVFLSRISFFWEITESTLFFALDSHPYFDFIRLINN